MFKYALFLVVALCAVQGFQARTVQVDERDVIDAINKMMDIVYQFKNVVANIVGKLPEIIEDIKNKALVIILDADVSGRVNKIQEEIQAIIATGEDGKKCADEQADEVTAFISNAQTDGTKCRDDMVSESQRLEGLMKSVIDQGNDLISSVAGRIRSCITGDGDVFKCLEDLIDPISEELAVLQQQVNDAISNAEEISEQGINNMGTCFEKVKADMDAHKEKIMADIEQCMPNLNKF